MLSSVIHFLTRAAFAFVPVANAIAEDSTKSPTTLLTPHNRALLLIDHQPHMLLAYAAMIIQK